MPPEYRDCPFCGDPVISAPTNGSAGAPRLFDELPSDKGRWIWSEGHGKMLRYTAETIPDGCGHLPHQASCRSWMEPGAPKEAPLAPVVSIRPVEAFIVQATG
jgi:hypothetical protein